MLGRLLLTTLTIKPMKLWMLFLALMILGLAAGAANSATTTVTYQVSASVDDGFAWSATEQDTASAFLLIGDDRTYTAPYYMSAMRFTDVNVPRSAAIIDARLKISSIDQEYRGQIYGVIQAESTDDAADFSGRYMADASKTAAAVGWDHKFAWDKNTWYTSPHISSVIQEIINRSGWYSENSLVVLYSTRTDSGKSRMFGSFEAGMGLAAILEVTYETYTISGHILTTEATPLENVAVSAGGDIESAVTDNNGYYELYVPLSWSGTVTASKTGWSLSPENRMYSNVTADQINQDYTAFRPEISGHVIDSNGTEVEGVLVSADYGGGSDTTDSNGYYDFSVPYNWSGTVTPSKVGWGFNPAGRAYNNVIADQIDESYIGYPPPIISGSIQNSVGLATEGVSVSADYGGGSDTTDSNGYYEIIVSYNWSGTVVPSKTAWTFDPQERSYENVVMDQSEQDFTSYSPPYSGGSGTASDPYTIHTAEQLDAVGRHSEYWRKHFKLMADIDLSNYTGDSFHIMGTGAYPNAFMGTFNGNGHEISNFTYHCTGRDNIGLFGYLYGVPSNGIYAKIQNLHLRDCDIDAGTGSDRVGSLVGTVRSATVSRCNVKGGSLRGATRVGGLVGYSLYEGTISNSCYIGSVSGGDYYIGGLVGVNYKSTISNSYSVCSLPENGHTVGGLVGKHDGGKIFTSYSTGSIGGTDRVGGLAGNVGSSQIIDSYSTCHVTGTTNNVGGLIGIFYSGTITDSFWDIETSRQTSSAGGTGLTTAEMQMKSTYTDAGWDFVGESANGTEDIWDIRCEGMNYPKLSWQISLSGDFICPDGVNFIDFSVFAPAWLSTSGENHWNPSCDISDPKDDVIDELDLSVFCKNWLAGTTP